MGPYRQHLLCPHRQYGTPAGNNYQIDAGIEAAALDRLQAGEVAIELPQQGTALLQVGDAGHRPARPGLGRESAMVRARHTDESPGATVAPHHLDPGAGDHPTHRETEQIDGLLGTEGRFDPGCQQGGGFGDGRHAKPQRQVGQQQGALQLAQIAQQPVEHPRAVEHAVHQHQRGGGSGDRNRCNLLDSKALLAALEWAGRRDPRPN